VNSPLLCSKVPAGTFLITAMLILTGTVKAKDAISSSLLAPVSTPDSQNYALDLQEVVLTLVEVVVSANLISDLILASLFILMLTTIVITSKLKAMLDSPAFNLSVEMNMPSASKVLYLVAAVPPALPSASSITVSVLDPTLSSKLILAQALILVLKKAQ